MRMVGADVEQLDALGRFMEQSGALLTAVRGSLDGSVLRARWLGHDMSRFVDGWSHNQAQLTRVGEELQRAGQQLRREAREQQATSASTGGAEGGRAPDLLSRFSRFNGAVQERLHLDTLLLPWKASDLYDAARAVKLRGRVLDDAAHLGQRLAEGAASLGRDVNHVVSGIDIPASSSRLGHDVAARISEIRVPDSVTSVGHAFETVGKISGVVGIASDSLAAYDSFQTAGSSLDSWLHVVDVGGDGLQASKIPYLYPVGFIAKEYSDVVGMAATTDWSQPLPPLNRHTLTQIYLPAIGGGVVDTGKMLVGDL